ncbi:Na+-driven multidrug efflux pump [Pseudobutyrivibrio sp. 49]|uniref:MATE family efflux transporter n=1 Tax=unclassified Pseudobutyrivibrio TaxID=2638619 RepID=UPI00088D752B|nr:MULTISPECIES: MATE family efflux transporter [unclassified Pseudobutyrivibrio]SDI23658.1 Na+-driven multidrug efflux pump [Pseudobutyrivibrio sp. 49]SFO14138.1 Na+-driven multidrug efflux pump [Pseudobutyrivibrio sp. UC1225]
MNQSTAMNPLGTEPVGTLLRKFAIPSIIAMLVGSLYNMVDQLFIGNFVGPLGNGATNIQFPLSILNVSIALLCGIGAASTFNLAMGRGETEKAGYYIGNAVSLMLIGGLALSIITELFLEPILLGCGATENILPYAMEYSRICAIGYPLFILSAGGAHIVRADGSPNMTMAINMTGAIINTVLDFLFVAVFKWGMTGAAVATIIGQCISGIMVLVYLTKFKTVKLHKEHFIPNPAMIAAVTSLGTAPFINQIAMMLVQITMNHVMGHYGAQSIYGSDIPITCAGIISKVNGICFSFVIGISQGLQPIISFNYGAKQYKRVKDALILALKLAACITFTSWACFQLFPRQIVSIFGSGDELYFQFCEKYFRIFLFGICSAFLQPISSNFFTSIGKPYKGIFMSLTRQVLFLAPLIIFLPMIFGFNGVLYAGPIADVLSFTICLILVKKEFNHPEFKNI